MTVRFDGKRALVTGAGKGNIMVDDGLYLL